jgi:thymidylate kinase
MVNFDWIYELNSKCIKPDLTIFLDVDAKLCIKRMQRRRWHVELFEEVKKLEGVRANYLKAINFLSSKQEKIVVVNGSQPIKEVHNEIMRAVKKALTQNRTATSKGNVTQQLTFEEIQS